MEGNEGGASFCWRIEVPPVNFAVEGPRVEGPPVLRNGNLFLISFAWFERFWGRCRFRALESRLVDNKMNFQNIKILCLLNKISTSHFEVLLIPPKLSNFCKLARSSYTLKPMPGNRSWSISGSAMPSSHRCS